MANRQRQFDPLNRYAVAENGCWIWQGPVNKNGYGTVSAWTGVNQAHRLFYREFVGPLEPSMEICHHCDNPPCVNPDHLFQGTKADNQRDCVNKGRDRNRRYYGETNPQAVLTEAAVLSIYKDERIQAEIAAEHGVHRTTVNLIKAKKKWAWLTAALGEPHRRPLGPRRSWEKARGI